MFVTEKTQLNGVLLLTNNVDFHILIVYPANVGIFIAITSGGGFREEEASPPLCA